MPLRSPRSPQGCNRRARQRQADGVGHHDLNRAVTVDVIYTIVSRVGVLPLVTFVLFYQVQVWLNGTLADHGITVQVVLVGDCPLTDGLRALLDAAHEAAVNAAKWSGAPQVSLFAEVESDAVMIFVRDRGRGFDPDSVPADRQGIARSIRRRVARYGGTVAIRSSPGEGTEVELKMPVSLGSPK